MSVAAAQSPSPANGSVFLTRDCVHFRDGEQSAAVRRCFAHAVLDHALSSPSDYSSAVDGQIKHLFASPPQLVLIQGPFKVDFILEEPPSPGTPKSVSTVSSSLTALNGPTSLIDTLYAGFTLHNELTRCQREDKDQLGRLSLFALATLVHESSHWLFTKIHGYRSDPLRPGNRKAGVASSISSGHSGHASKQKQEDPLVSLGTKPDDAGARTVDMLLGATYSLVSFADGDTEVIRRKIQPAITNESPVLTGSALESILGTKLAKMTDITGHAPVVVGGQPPKWSEHDTYLVTSQLATNSYCNHGVCRIGQLF